MSSSINIADYEEINDLISRVQKRRRYDDQDGLELHGDTRAFLQNMMDVERTDRELNRAGKPAIGKIKMLPQVTAKLTNKKLHNQLLDALVLQRIRDWLRPMPDGSLPNTQLRSELFRLLALLPIDSDHLQESEGLGIELMRLWRSADENAANKKALRLLVEKWLRAILKSAAGDNDAPPEAEDNPQRTLELMHRRERQQAFLQRGRKRKGIIPAESWFEFEEGGDQPEATGDAAVPVENRAHRRIEDKFVAMDRKIRAKKRK